MRNIRCLVLGSSRMVGKDTFFSLLSKHDKRFKRWAFADILKEYCEPLCAKAFNKSINELLPYEKELFRPVLIEVGRLFRSIDEDYWVKQVHLQINKILSENSDTIPVITDGRFANEYNYFRRIYGDSVLFVNINRTDAPEPTEEEKKHIPELMRLMDDNISWKTDPSFSSLQPTVTNFYKKYFNQ